MQIGEAQGVTSELSGGYPLQTIQGIVKGYDEKNMWLIIDLLS